MGGKVTEDNSPSVLEGHGHLEGVEIRVCYGVSYHLCCCLAALLVIYYTSD